MCQMTFSIEELVFHLLFNLFIYSSLHKPVNSGSQLKKKKKKKLMETETVCQYVKLITIILLIPEVSWELMVFIKNL